jgi:competence protein ComEC
MTAPAATTAPPTTTASQPRSLFGGYVLVACVAAWLAGIALRPVGPLAALAPAIWLALAAVVLAIAVAAGIANQQLASHVLGGAFAVALLALFVALGAARAASADPSADPHAIARLATGQQVRLRGVVATEPDLRDGYRFLTVETGALSLDGGRTYQTATGRVEATVYGPDSWAAPAYGDAVSLSGKLEPLGAGYAPPGVLARLTHVRATVVTRGNGNPLLAWLYDLRLRLAQAIQHALPEPEAALLIGILLGLKTPVLRARLPLFTATGTIHLVVPAGLKVATLAELTGAALRPLGRWPRTLGGLAAVAVYAAVGGGGPAAIRAAIMGGLLALAPALGRAYNVFTALALAALVMTAIEPSLLYDAGFQLTTLATLGLPLLVPPIQRRLARWLRWMPASAVVAELLAVTLAAQAATLPVLALTFHQLSLVAPFANLLTVPLLAPLLVLGLLVALPGAFLGAAGATLALAAGFVTWPLLWFMDTSIALCASLPAAALPIGDVPGVLAWLYYAALAAGLFWLAPLLRARRARAGAGATPPSSPVSAHSGHVRLSRGLLLAALAVAVLGATGAAAPPLLDRSVHLAFLDVGAGGEAALLRLPGGPTVLINGGPSGPALETALAGALPVSRRSLDLAMLTDPRPGDARGLQDAAGHFTIAASADMGMRHPSQDYLAWLDAMRRAGAVHTQIRRGAALQLDARTRIRVLSPPQGLYPENEGGTTASDDAILRLETPGLRALFLGAADTYALDALAYSGQPLASDVVEVALPSGAPLDLESPLGRVLALAHPRLIVVCSAPISPSSLAARRAAASDPWDTDADAATALGASIIRIEQAGTVELSGDAGGWALG